MKRDLVLPALALVAIVALFGVAYRAWATGHMSTFLLWYLVAGSGIDCLSKIAAIGVPRKPITRSDAIAALVANTILVVLLWNFWGGR